MSKVNLYPLQSILSCSYYISRQLAIVIRIIDHQTIFLFVYCKKKGKFYSIQNVLKISSFVSRFLNNLICSCSSNVYSAGRGLIL